MKIYKIIAIGVVFAAASCQNKSTDSTTPKVEGYETSKNGLQYKIISDNPGSTGKVGEVLEFSSTIRTLKGDLVFTTNESNKPTFGMVAQPDHKGDPIEVLQMVGEGDSVSVILPEKEFFKGGVQLPPTVKEGDNIRMDIKVWKIYSAEQYKNEVVPQINAAKYEKETRLMDDYIASKGWSAATLPSGLKVVIDKNGDGPEVTDGAQLKVNYTGRLLDGTVFDSNVDPQFNHVQPFELTIGKKMVIPGWEEGLKNFKQGGKGKLIIPARLGYGERGSGKIPPNSPLVFEIEVLEVKPSA